MLAQLLADQIRRDGPMTFHEWMQAALYHPEFGYYCRTDLNRWGREGDYRTSPETSPLFAATFARYFLKLYRKDEPRDGLTIVEVGAGSGHFAQGLLETLKRSSADVFEQTTYLIDEISKHTSEQIVERLSRFRDQLRFGPVSVLHQINWGIVFANELLDAMPVHRIAMRNGKLTELYVKLRQDDSFCWHNGLLSAPRLNAYLERFNIELSDGQIVDINLQIEDWLSSIAARLVHGYLVIVDYGSESEELYSNPKREHGTLRAFKRHRIVDDVLSSPGEQDLTSTVDWNAVKQIGNELGFELREFKRLDEFLLEAGFLEELEKRANEAHDEGEKLQLRATAREMILPGRMAESFQVLVMKK